MEQSLFGKIAPRVLSEHQCSLANPGRYPCHFCIFQELNQECKGISGHLICFESDEYCGGGINVTGWSSSTSDLFFRKNSLADTLAVNPIGSNPKNHPLHGE